MRSWEKDGPSYSLKLKLTAVTQIIEKKSNGSVDVKATSMECLSKVHTLKSFWRTVVFLIGVLPRLPPASWSKFPAIMR